VIFGTAHEPDGQTSAAVFATILAVMAALALFGAWAAGRVRAPGTRPAQPVVPDAR
jgi:hypothetical protein